MKSREIIDFLERTTFKAGNKKKLTALSEIHESRFVERLQIQENNAMKILSRKLRTSFLV